MKLIISGLLALASTAAAYAGTDIAGQYVSVDAQRYRLTVGTDHRIRTNIQAIVPSTGMGVPLHFPHRLKKGEDGVYVTRGTFTMTFTGLTGFVQCTFPVRFEGEFDADAENVDVFFVAPRYYGVDQFGRCLQQGLIRQPFGFRRVGS